MATKILRHMARMMLDTLFPPRCFACASIISEHGHLCAGCWQDVEFIAAPLCQRCGVPFPYDMGKNAQCMACLQTPPAFAMARSVFRYDDASRRLVTAYKYYDRTYATPMFSRWLQRAGVNLLAEADVLVPVPLHRWRLVRRRYNQSALLARELARQSSLPCLPAALQRTRHTAQQAGLNRKQRAENVMGAFTVPTRYQPQLAGKTVLLIDDVFTTGATLNACTHALLAVEVKAVYVLTLARVLTEEV